MSECETVLSRDTHTQQTTPCKMVCKFWKLELMENRIILVAVGTFFWIKFLQTNDRVWEKKTNINENIYKNMFLLVLNLKKKWEIKYVK